MLPSSRAGEHNELAVRRWATQRRPDGARPQPGPLACGAFFSRLVLRRRTRVWCWQRPGHDRARPAGPRAVSSFRSAGDIVARHNSRGAPPGGALELSRSVSGRSMPCEGATVGIPGIMTCVNGILSEGSGRLAPGRHSSTATLTGTQPSRTVSPVPPGFHLTCPPTPLPSQRFHVVPPTRCCGSVTRPSPVLCRVRPQGPREPSVITTAGTPDSSSPLPSPEGGAVVTYSSLMSSVNRARCIHTRLFGTHSAREHVCTAAPCQFPALHHTNSSEKGEIQNIVDQGRLASTTTAPPA